MTLNLSVKIRKQTGKKIKTLREQGQIPAVLYGHKTKNQNLAVNYQEFEKVYQQAGESTLIDLNIDNKEPIKVLVQDIQLDPLSNRFLHIDFRQVTMGEKLKAEIGLKFVGEPPAIKELSGILVTNLNSLEVECLPKDLIHEIEVDLSKLKTFDDLIHVSDLKIPEGITVLDSLDEVVALIQPPRTEEELKELEEKPVVAEAVEGEEEKGEAVEGEEVEGEVMEGEEVAEVVEKDDTKKTIKKKD